MMPKPYLAAKLQPRRTSACQNGVGGAEPSAKLSVFEEA
jgi:hypothetical protein